MGNEVQGRFLVYICLHLPSSQTLLTCVPKYGTYIKIDILSQCGLFSLFNGVNLIVLLQDLKYSSKLVSLFQISI